MSHNRSKLARSRLTLDSLHEGQTDYVNPSWLVDHQTGFFVINCGRYREFGFCCGRMRWSYREAHVLMHKVAVVLRRFKAELSA